MATYEEHVEGLTKTTISATGTTVTQSQFTEYLKEAVITTVDKIIAIRPEEISKFTKTTNAVDSVVKKGKILSVMREHNSTSILRPCTPINPSLRYEATDSDSLHYRSKYNPGYYELNGLIICVPEASGSGNNDIVVTQVEYDTGLINSDNYLAGAIENFPIDYEPLIALHVAAKVCEVNAHDIHNNMPELPEFGGTLDLPSPPSTPEVPVILSDSVDLPDLPRYIPPVHEINLGRVLTALNVEDFELADKELSVLEKVTARYEKMSESALNHYNKELEIFRADINRVTANEDRKIEVLVNQYKADIEKYTADISNYQNESTVKIGEYTQNIARFQQELSKFNSDLQETMARYTWFKEQQVSFINQYNMGIIGGQAPQSKDKGEG
tara:strand:+ start:210 stop:1364 length:1155 start_codon:yes stop_codon:yes gene_type:complete